MNHQSYRPDVDGLRAVAIFLVLLFHADLACTGGYIGVDVFFVISGFLITSLIWAGLHEDLFSIVDFWERRARRILPASVFVSVVTMVAGWFLLLPSDFAKLGRALLAQATFTANMFFWSQSGYFAEPADQLPLLHHWSLAIEEQFYLLIPLVFMLACTVFRKSREKVMAIICLVVIGTGLLLSAYAVTRYPSATFYLLPFRAWELMLGSLLAFIPVTWCANRKGLHELSSGVGLALILIPAVLYGSETHFPGPAAVPPCLGTAMLIWSNGRAATLTRRILSIRPVVFVGLISYSLYLWHWPLFAFSKYWALGPLPLYYRLGLLVLSFVLAVWTWRFVETPFRQRRVASSRRALFFVAGAAISCLLLLGVVVVRNHGFPQRVPASVRGHLPSMGPATFARELTTSDILNTNLVPFGVRDPQAPISLVVWGDSHAMTALTAFDSFCMSNGIAGLAATHSAVAPVVGFINGGLGDKSLLFNEAVCQFIEENQIPHVVLAANWQHYSGDPNKAEDPASTCPIAMQFDAALLRTVERLVRSGTKPWIIQQIPPQPFNVPKALIRSTLLGVDYTALCATPSLDNGFAGSDRTLESRLQAAGATLLDPRPGLLSTNGQTYCLSRNGKTLYGDSNHLTPDGAELVLLPLLNASFRITPEP